MAKFLFLLVLSNIFSLLLTLDGFFLQKQSLQCSRLTVKNSYKLINFSPAIISKCDQLFTLNISSDRKTLNTIKIKLEKITELLEKTEKSIFNSTVNIETAAYSISIVEKAIESNTEKLSNIEKSLKSLKDAEKLLSEEKDEKNLPLNQENMQLDEKEQLRDEIKGLRDEIKRLQSKQGLLIERFI